MSDERGVERDESAQGSDAPAGPPEGAGLEPLSGGDALPDADAGVAPDETTQQLEALQSELESLNDRHLRLAAEFDNYRKRIERERADLVTRAQAEVVRRLLDALDDLQRVAHYEAAATSIEALLEGVGLVEKKLRHALESAGLEPIEARGEFFNPSTMEAVLTVAAEHPEEDEVVADEFQKGYRFKSLLIRPAKVRVKKYETS